tara:strand:+ start:632 stop:1642 length:1011 start_codon:yes stop_codon:yes gene_type:complete
MNKTKYSQFFKILLSFFITVLIIELVTRTVLLFFTNINIYKYGIKKNIYFDVIDMSKLEFVVYENKENKYLKNNNEDFVWIFGGSTTCCGCGNSSWPEQLSLIQKNFKYKNFALSGANSDHQLSLLYKEIIKKRPKVILWANKFNTLNVTTKSDYKNKEILNYDFKSSSKNNLILKIKRLDKTLKSYLVTYLFFDEIMERINIILYENKITQLPKLKLSEDDVYYAVQNFKINTIKAIETAKKNQVDEFYLVSLFYNKNIRNNSAYSLKYNFYNEAIYEIKNLYYPFVKIIDLEKIFDSQLDEDLFCDEIHQTIKGNVIQAELIYKELVAKSNFIK